MPITSQISKPADTLRLDRCKALTDGVFAIVVTLLVLGIEVPTQHNFSEQGLLKFLDRISVHVWIYGISFWLAGTYWVQHSAIMHYFRLGTRRLFWLNLLFLFPVTLLPFLTALAGSYRFEPLVTLLFSGLQVLIGLTLILLWNYAVANPSLLAHHIGKSLAQAVNKRIILSPILISLVAIPISFLSINLSRLLLLSIPLYYLSHHDLDRNLSDSESG